MVKAYFTACEQAFPAQQAQLRRLALALGRGGVERMEQLCALQRAGPEGLLESVAERAAAHGVPCQLSMERRMACGIGICLGCAIAIHTPGGVTYKKVCKDGPVFRGEEVAFHAQP